MGKHPLRKNDDGTFTMKSLSSCDYTDQISVLVGPDEQPFLICKDVICAKSKFFRAACSERWVSGREKKVSLPDIDASVFQCYLTWVYCGRLDVKCISIAAIDDLHYKIDRNIIRHLELYILGDVLDDVRLRNSVLRTLVTKIQSLGSPEGLKLVWEKMPDNAPIRRMLVDRATLRTRQDYLIENVAQYPESFVQQVTATLLQGVPGRSKEVFEARLPSYLETVGDGD